MLFFGNGVAIFAPGRAWNMFHKILSNTKKWFLFASLRQTCWICNGSWTYRKPLGPKARNHIKLPPLAVVWSSSQHPPSAPQRPALLPFLRCWLSINICHLERGYRFSLDEADGPNHSRFAHSICLIRVLCAPALTAQFLRLWITLRGFI